MLKLVYNNNFFLNQQFITQNMKVDHGSYFVTTYIQIEAIWKENKKRNKQEKAYNSNYRLK